MPHANAPARSNMARTRTNANNSYARAGNGHTYSNNTHTGSKAKAALATSGPVNPGTGTTGTVNARTTNTALVGTPGTFNRSTAALGGATSTNLTNPAGFSPNTYTYGQGTGARSYRAYGYGAGYRNRYYGGGYGYGRSQGNNRAIVGRLRSVQMNLARIDHDYQGHRVQAMHSVSMAIRQLSHRSMIYSGVGFAPGMNNGRAMGMGMGMGMGNGGRGGQGGGVGGRGRGRMSQAQSDARMSQSLRVLQGINMQLGSQSSYTTGHARARGHVMSAIQQLNVALSIR